MKVKKSILERIVREELMSYFRDLNEDFSLQAEKEKKEDDAPEVMDAEQEKGSKDKAKGKDKELSKSSKKPEKGPKAPPKDDEPKSMKPAGDEPEGDEDMSPPELPVGDEPSGADDELGAEAGGDEEGEEEEDASDVTGGKIADEVVGKSIQSLTMEPDSKTLPGAQEINITFSDSPEPLKILVTKTGQVKFLHHGGLHNKV
jgi:hypothetical protein